MEGVEMAGKEETVVDVVAPTEVNGEKLPGGSLLNGEEDAQENMERLKAELDRISSALLDSELKAKRADELEDQLCSLQEELRSLHEKNLEKEKIEASMDSDSEMAKPVAEKEALEAPRKELTEDLEQMRGRCVDLESELRQSREEFGKVDEFMADVLGKNTELEEKLKSLERLLEESRAKEASSDREKLELQDLVQAANTALEEARLELQERDLELEAANQKKVELEDQLNFSESKYDDAGRSLQEHRNKISELESALSKALALKSELEVKLENRIEELEQEMETFEQKRREAESESEKYSDMASELKIELEVAGQRERELTESLNAIMEEKGKSEEALHDSVVKLHDTENLIEGLRGELSATQGKLQGTENDLKDAEIREREILEKLKCAEEKLEQQGRVLEEATATLRKEIEQQLEVLNNKDSEVKFLCDELQTAQRRKLVHEEKEAEAKGKVADLVEELDQSSMKLEDTERKVGELQALLDSSMETAKELRNQLARSQERQSEVEASFLQAQAEIEEAGLKLSHKKMEAEKLRELLGQTEEKLKIYEVQLHESDTRVESTEGKLRQASVTMAYQENMIEKLEDALSQLETHNGDLEGEKMKLKAELAELESKLNGLQEELSASLEERSTAVVLLESQVSSIKEEKQAMESELIVTQGKLWSVEDDLKSAEGQLHQKGKALEEANARNMELESLSEYLSNDVELRLQEVTEILNRKEAESKSFAKELQTVTHTKMEYEEQAAQAADKVAAMEDELDQSSTKRASLESLNEELKKMLEDAEGKCAETLSENELLAKTNLDLKSKVGELQELLELAIVEKQKIARQLASSMDTTEELKNQLAMSHKLQSEAEARFLQAQTELNRYQVQLHNSAAMEESRKFELEQTFAELLDEEKNTELLGAMLSQLQTHYGDLAEGNLKLNQLQSQLALIMEQKQVLESELIATRGKLQGIGDDLKASEIREDEIVKRLKYAEGQAEQQGKALEEANAKIMELESLNANLRKDVELKLQEAMGTVDSKEAEAKLWAEKLQLRNPHKKPSGHQSEVEARLLQVQTELHEKTEILTRMELEAKALNAKLGQLEEHNGALAEEKKKFEEELERALIRLNDLQAELCAKTAEKDAAVENFNSSLKMIEDLKQEWAFERQSFESKIASIIEEKEHIKEAAAVSQNALRVLIAQLQGRLKESGQSYESLDAEMENLKVKAAETTALQTRVKELEERFEKEETKPGAIVVAGKTKKDQTNEGKSITAVIGVALMSIIMGLVLKKK